MLQDLRNKIANFMYDRVGLDNLNRALIYSAVVVNILLIFFHTTFLIVVNTLLIFIAGYRFFSKDHAKRSDENSAFEGYLGKTKDKLNDGKRVKELKKTHYLFKCPRCGLKMKIPKNRGKVKITCTKCSCEFEVKS